MLQTKESYLTSISNYDSEENSNIDFLIDTLLINNCRATIFDIIYYLFFTETAINDQFELIVGVSDSKTDYLTIIPSALFEQTSALNKITDIEFPSAAEELIIMNRVAEAEKQNLYVYEKDLCISEKYAKVEEHFVESHNKREINQLALSSCERKKVYHTNLNFPKTTFNTSLLIEVAKFNSQTSTPVCLYYVWSKYVAKVFDAIVENSLLAYTIPLSLLTFLSDTQTILIAYCDYLSYGKYECMNVINFETSTETTLYWEQELYSFPHLWIEDSQLVVIFKPNLIF